MLYVLAIGNSFSEDSTARLESLGEGLYVRNLYIGGCSLERHYNNMISGECAYHYQAFGCRLFNISLKEALLQKKWDIITLQQVSGNSGIEDTFYPYLTELKKYVKEYCPGAELRLHRTWAYAKGASHSAYSNYDNDHDKMWEAIKRTYDSISKREDMKIIPAGDLVQYLCTLPDFDPEKGGIPMHRDGYHLSRDYGRYAASMVWRKELTGEISEVVPEDLDPEVCAVIREALRSQGAKK